MSGQQELAVFDCHHHYGTLVLSAGKRAAQLEAAREDEVEYSRRIGWMDNAGIDAGIIMPVNRYLRPHGVPDTQRVNDEVAKYRDEHRERFPIAVGITEPVYGEDGLAEIARLDEELGMLGVSYHTRWQGVATDDPWVIRGIAEMEPRRMLPFIHSYVDSALESPATVTVLAERFPDIPFIVTDALSGHTQQVQYLQIAKRLPNLHFDTSCVYNIGVIRAWVGEVGAERLVFGSDTYSAHMVTMNHPALIRSCGISAADAQLILRDNLLRLLSWTGREF